MPIPHQQAMRVISDLKVEAGSGDKFVSEQGIAKAIAKVKTEIDASLIQIRIAILASHTLDHFLPILESRLILAGFAPELYLTEFGTATQSVLNEKSSLYNFKPDVVWFFSTHRDLDFIGRSASISEEHIADTVNIDVQKQSQLIKAVKERCDATVIVNNSDLSSIQSTGNFSASDPCSEANLILRYNHELVREIGRESVVFDFYSISTFFGAKNWIDNRFWHHSKHAFSFDTYGTITHRFSRIIAAIKGKSAKCLVLDLDNTLWGGVIGDDGIEGIEIGNGSGADGEAFLEIQRYVRELRSRGIILAVCSKNELEAAQLPFKEHPDILLSLDDFASFKANWQNKADNIHLIAEEINIGTDALVFLDDNPVERNLVRQILPEVHVPELSDDPSDYVETLDQLRLFETLSIEDEDKKRADYYTANRKRSEIKSEFHDIKSYLKSLEMQAIVTDANGVSRSRAVQLLNKSNQFNLNGSKTTDGELETYIRETDHFTICFRLKDKFGDNGIISVVLFKIEDKTLIIDRWVMSCRVLARGMEEVVIATLGNYGKEKGVTHIKGHWQRSDKNKLVELLYQRLGFETLSKNDNYSSWIISVSEAPKNDVIDVVNSL